jgi:hypothetical protein
MALGAGNPRVRRMAVRNKFRLHDAVASLTAELDRFGIVIGLVGANCGDQQEKHRAGQEKPEESPVAFARQINTNGREWASGLYDMPVSKKCADNRHHEANNCETGRDEICQDADVRVGKVSHRLQQQQEEEGEYAANNYDKPA